MSEEKNETAMNFSGTVPTPESTEPVDAAAPEATTERAAPESESQVEARTEAVETAAAETTPETTTTPEKPAPVTEPETDRNVPLGALIAERKRSQGLKAENEALRAQIAQAQGYMAEGAEGTVEQPAPHQMQGPDPRFLELSEYSARQAHKDYDEKFNAFLSASEKNPSLLDKVMGSLNPGEQAYVEGEKLIRESKYGRDFETQKKRIVEEERAKIRKEVEAEILGKAKARSNQPTNILNGRAAGGGGAEADFRMPSWSDALGG